MERPRRGVSQRRSRTPAIPISTSVVALCEPGPGVQALDVATGGGHVARRLREAGAEVVTVDAAAGNGARRRVARPRACRSPTARSTSSSRGSRRITSPTSPARSAEMARVDARRGRDRGHALHLRRPRAGRDAARSRRTCAATPRPSGARFLEGAGLAVEHVDYFRKTHDTEDWLARTGCEGETAARVRELLAPVASDDGTTWQDTKLILKARKA